MDTKISKKKTGYLPGLDVIRGIAILGVVLYHLVPHVFTGGFLGVNLFLVLSGFLINRSLEKEFKRSSRIDYINFFSRRLSRTFTPMFWMVVVLGAFLFLFQKQLLNNYLGEAVSSILFFNNWWQIGMGSSYFMKFLNPSTITHLWYLSVQVQFYIVWLIVFVLTKRYSESTRSNKAPTVYLVLTIISAVLMAVLFKTGEDPTRVYYGTDTRLFSFSFGALLSLYHRDRAPRKSRRKAEISKRRRKAGIKPFGFISLAIILIMFFTVQDSSAFTFRGGMLLFTIFSGSLIFAAVNPNMTISELFESSVILKGLGKRSYSIYLWYYPVMTVFNVMTKDKGINIFLGYLIQLAIIMIMAQISYVLFERNYIMIPFYQFEGIEKEKEKFRLTWFDRKNMRIIPKIMFSLLSVLLILAVIGVSTFKANNDAAEDLQAKIEANQKKLESEKTEKKPEKKEEKEKSENDKKEKDDKDSDKEKDKEGKEEKDDKDSPSDIEGLTKGEAEFAKNLDVTFIGDSMLLMAVDPISTIFPKAEVDGAVGRQLYQSGSVVDMLKAQDRLYDTVVIVLGANGSFTESQFDQFTKNIGEDKKIFLVTTNAHTEWKDTVNQSFIEKSKENSNMYLVDWDTYLGDNPDWLEPDGTHPNLTGAEKMVVLIAKEIYKEEAPDEKSEDKKESSEKNDKDTKKDSKDKKSDEKEKSDETDSNEDEE